MKRRRLFELALAGTALALPTIGARATGPDAAMTVYKSPWCGCCGEWISHVEAAGFTIDARDVDDVTPIKRMAGVPDELASCHTASIDGYVVEGHVPADVIRRLLAERPAVRGIAVPGMPIGSPGMEGPSPETYTVYTFGDDGTPARYAVITP